MDKLKRILSIFMIFTGMNSAFAHADVIVSIPNSQAPLGGILTLPVEIRNIESPGMIAYQFTISFDDNVLRFRDVLKTGTVTETWTDPVSHQQHNQGKRNNQTEGSLTYLFHLFGRRGAMVNFTRCNQCNQTWNDENHCNQ